MTFYHWNLFFLIFISGLQMIATQIVAQNESKDFFEVSVVKYGTKGDGNQNDAPAIQKALDSGAKVVIFPPGIYKIDTTLWIGSGVTLKADPQAVIRLADSVGNNASIFLLSNRNPGNGNSNITVEGGIWDGNNEHNRRGKADDPLGYSGTAINFINVKNLVLRNLTVRNPDAYSIRLGEVEDFLVENIVFDHSVIRPNQDGVHIGGFSERGMIRHIRAIHPSTTSDDMIAINADDNVEGVGNRGLRRGPIRNILVEDLQGEDVYTFVRILSKESQIENIIVRGVKGSCRRAVNINNWQFPIGSGNICNVLLEQFDVIKTDLYVSLIIINLKVHNLYIRDFQRRNNPKTDHTATLYLNNDQENTFQKADGLQHKISEYTISGGGIQDLWINRSSILQP